MNTKKVGRPVASPPDMLSRKSHIGEDACPWRAPELTAHSPVAETLNVRKVRHEKYVEVYRRYKVCGVKQT